MEVCTWTNGQILQEILGCLVIMLLDSLINIYVQYTHAYTRTVSVAYGREFIAVDGGWSSWRYEPCSKSCGGGRQCITRECIDPRPSCGGKNCTGLSIDWITCNDYCCPSKFM